MCLFLLLLSFLFVVQIWEKYESQILPLISKDGDDGQYGSAAVCDIQVCNMYNIYIYIYLFDLYTYFYVYISTHIHMYINIYMYIYTYIYQFA